MGSSNRVLHIEHGRNSADAAAALEDSPAITVITETTATDGLDFLDTETCDCIVSTPELPDMEWTAFLDKVRMQDDLVPVVLYTRDDHIATNQLTRPRVDVVREHEHIWETLPERVENYASLKQQKEERRGQRDQFQRFFDQFPDPAITYNQQEQVVVESINRACADVFECDADAIRGKPFREILAPVGDNIDIDAVVDSIEAGKSVDREVKRDTKSGERSFRFRSVPSTVDTGGFAVYTDITEQRRREEQLLERETELEQQKENLQTQKAQLEYQNERLDEFASIVSHDLRNPLNVAKGRLDILLKRLEKTDADIDPQHGREVERSLNRMESIIADALTLAREGRAVTDTQPVPLQSVVEQAWANVDTKEARLDSCRNVEIESEESRLLNVFENLFRNAVEHGGESVTIRVGLLTDGFYIEDTGPGISEEDKQQIFEKGFTTSRDGTGFGLAIVEDVVRAHGWDITVSESTSGGARFEMTGVEFSWEKADLVDVLSETLGYKKATDLVAEGMTSAGIEHPRFDRETAVTILAEIAARDDVSSLAEVAARTAMKQITS